jgi:hypothetical protein
MRVRKVFIFLTFLKVVFANPNALVAALIPPPKGVGELMFGNGLHGPYPACLAAVLGQQEASSLLETGKSPLGRYSANRRGGGGSS